MTALKNRASLSSRPSFKGGEGAAQEIASEVTQTAVRRLPKLRNVVSTIANALYTAGKWAVTGGKYIVTGAAFALAAIYSIIAWPFRSKGNASEKPADQQPSAGADDGQVLSELADENVRNRLNDSEHNPVPAEPAEADDPNLHQAVSQPPEERDATQLRHRQDDAEPTHGTDESGQ